MVVGQAGCGKTTIYNLLTKALTNIPNSLPYEITRLNPKAFTGQQMYGCNNKVGEWEEGIFSNIWKRKNAKTEKKYNWIQADGPVDAIWIENLDTVLDDNRILTLANAERIPMSDLTKMTFEVENLNNASPATVSRCGIIYVSPNELGWEPLVQTWSLDKQRNKEAGVNWKWMFTNDKKDNLKDKDGAAIADYNWNWFVKNIKKYLKAHDEKLGGNPTKFKNTFEWCEKFLNFKMFTPEVVRITQLINLTEAVCYEEFTGNQEPLKELQFEKIFVYAFAWALAGLCDTTDR
jgi:dynein heavy chain